VKKTSFAGLPIGFAAGMTTNGVKAKTANAGLSAILLISDDAEFGRKLELAVERIKRPVVRVTEPAKATRTIRTIRPGAVLLDLDLPDQAAWRSADLLLQDEICVPIILLTGRTEQFDVRTAIRAGALVEKAVGPDRLLESLDRAVSTQGSARNERNAVQRNLIQWLRPWGWSVPFTPARSLSAFHD
jgi:DNA-binding response OmpR family regulator